MSKEDKLWDLINIQRRATVNLGPAYYELPNKDTKDLWAEHDKALKELYDYINELALDKETQFVKICVVFKLDGNIHRYYCDTYSDAVMLKNAIEKHKTVSVDIVNTKGEYV